MAKVTNNVWQEGEVPTAAELNQPYDDAAALSITAENTKDNWVTDAHWSTAGQPVNQIRSFNNETTVSWSTNSTSYVTVAANSIQSICSLNFADLDLYEVLRVECSGLVTFIELSQTYDETASPPSGDRNYYAFRLVLNRTDLGGTTSDLVLGEWGYSFTSMAGGTSRYLTAPNGLPENTGVPIGFQTFQFSTIRYETGFHDTLNSIRLEAKVFHAGNTLKISRNSITAVRARR